MDYTNILGHLSGHIASLLTMAAYLLKDILWLRLLTILSCIAGIIFNYAVPATPLWTIIYWNLLFAAINMVQIAIIIRERSGINFTDEEKELHETLFKHFAPFEFMKLMRIARWSVANAGDILASEQDPVDSVMLIYNGRAVVTSKGVEMARLKDGNFVGEVSFITGGMASATVSALEPTRYVSWAKKDIRALLQRNPSMASAMQRVLSTDLSKKLSRHAPTFEGKKGIRNRVRTLTGRR